jgi:hypothetical protein
MTAANGDLYILNGASSGGDSITHVERDIRLRGDDSEHLLASDLVEDSDHRALEHASVGV